MFQKIILEMTTPTTNEDPDNRDHFAKSMIS